MPSSAQLEQVQPHQLVGTHPERAGDADQRLEGRAQFPPLDPADVVAVQPRVEAELLLRKPPLRPQLSDRGAERQQVAYGGREGFGHNDGRSQAPSPPSTSFPVTSYREVQAEPTRSATDRKARR